MGMCFHAAGQRITSLGMCMILCGISADRVLRDDDGFKTSVSMDMYLGCGFPADQNRLRRNLRFRGFRLPFFQTAADHGVPLIAFISMTMAGDLFQLAMKLRLIAAFPVDVIFLQSADHPGFCTVTGFIVNMEYLAFFHAAVDHSGIAATLVAVIFGNGADGCGNRACFCVDMFFDDRHRCFLCSDGLFCVESFCLFDGYLLLSHSAYKAGFHTAFIVNMTFGYSTQQLRTGSIATVTVKMGLS